MNAPSVAQRLISSVAALALLAAFPVQAQTAAPSQGAPIPLSVKAPPPAPAAPRPWFYKDSDVPMDLAWRFGELPNGLRYAIRHNDVPAGQVSMRVRVDVGSLMEKPAEAGFAHFIEHLSFRGSRNVPDGESKRIWQRLGANFGSDSNAQTTPTGTTYALDLPNANPAGLDESLKILAGMLSEPNIVPQAVEAERAVVMAERREGMSPGTRVGDQSRKFYFAGQPLGDHSPIGTEETLKGATTAALKAFHDRWYRPDRTVIAISGDADVAVLEEQVKKHFSAWQADGPATPLPDFGKPDPKAPSSKVIVEPSVATSIGMVYMRPWKFNQDTVAFNQLRLTDDLALQLINRRLETAAASGASFLQAQVERNDSSRSISGTYVSIVPIGDDWEKALREVRAIIEDAKTKPPSEADINRDFIALDSLFAQGVATSAIESSARQTESLVGAIDIRETVVSPQAQLDIYRSGRAIMTPAKILESTRRMFTGTAVRTLLTLKTAQPNALARLNTALRVPVKAASNARLDAKEVTMASLPALPPAGLVTGIRPIGVLGIEQVNFGNGVTLFLRANKAEPGKVRVQVRFGNGQQSFSPTDDAALWAAPFGIMASGIGDLDQRALTELTNGRQLALSFGIDEDAFTLSAVSSPEDYKDQLRLYASKLAFPRWDAAPLARSLAALKVGYDPMPSSAAEALQRDVSWLLRDKDKRLAPATPADAPQLTLEKFKSVWEPRLASGPIEVQLYGDFTREEGIEAVAATFGALPARQAAPPPAANKILRFPDPSGSPVILHHNGDPAQAAAVIAWPTGGGETKIKESRQLEMLARIVNDRLFEKLRSIDGAAYTPSADSVWPEAYDNGGYLVIQSQLRPERIGYFFSLMDEVAADLVANPVTPDELERQVAPVRQLLGRARASNAFWLSQLEGLSRDPRKLEMAYSLSADMLEVTPADLQALAQRYLKSSTRWSAIVLAKGVPMPAIPRPKLAANDSVPPPAPTPAPATPAVQSDN
jgi:zinc protease